MSSEQRRGLGRGLDSLIPGAGTTGAGDGVTAVDIDALEPNPFQPRAVWPDDEIDELAASIAEHGVIQPLIVTHATGETPYQIIAGERRWRAARRAGLSRVPVLIREVSSLEALEIALVENVQREDLNPIEEALAYRQLSDEFGLTQEQIARRVGKSRSTVANIMRLLDAPEQVRAAVMNSEITAGHARAILSAGDRSAQLAVLEKVLAGGLNVRQTERLVTQAGRARSAPKDRPRLSPDEEAVRKRLQSQLGTRVDLTRTSNKAGRIVIHFYSDEELNEILDRIALDSF